MKRGGERETLPFFDIHAFLHKRSHITKARDVHCHFETGSKALLKSSASHENGVNFFCLPETFFAHHPFAQKFQSVSGHFKVFKNDLYKATNWMLQ